MPFSNKIIRWYDINKRELPWRKSKKPYNVWLSEIILQQTRVAQGTPYYLKILKKFPTVAELAKAEEKDVLSLWQGLGYYSRGRNLHACAQQVINDYNGVFPSSSKELQKLKGIGKYTSAAIASFCFDEVIPVIDGNVYRVLSRYLDLEQDISASQAYKVFEEAAFELIDREDPGKFNQAIMEFGALLCTPKKPNCIACPLQDSCESFRLKIVENRPIKTKKVKVRNRFFDYIVIMDKKGLLLKERKKGDIWQGLNDFPLIENEELKKEISAPILNDLMKNNAVKKHRSEAIKHVLTHQVIKARFHSYEISEEVKAHFIDKYDLKYFSFAKLSDVPKPVLVTNYLKSDLNSLDLI